MAKYEQYAEYKGSGVEWLGDIPKDWSIARVKNQFDVFNGSTPKSGEVEYWEGDIVWVTPSDLSQLEGYKISGSLRNITTKGLHSCGTSLVPKGSMILSCRAPIGSLAVAGTELCTNQGCKTLVPTSGIPVEYYYYYFSTVTNVLNNLGRGSTFLELSTEDLTNLAMPLPSISESYRVVEFLDHETAQIDTLIEKQQTLIKLLKEKRQAVISHAVTKGLNPDAPMKDSGVEWLGEVPEHWEVLPAKRFFKLVAEPAASNNDYELLSVYTAIGVRPRKDLEQKGNKASTTDGYWKVERGDIVVNKLLAWMGAVGYSDYEGVTSPAYDILRATKDINSKFYHYLFRTRLANMEFKRWSRGIMEMRLRLYFDELGRIFMPLPSKQEQDLIVKKIEKMDNQFDDLIKKSEYNIKLMQERRTALISAAVTGKIDVRGWRASESNTILESL